jgi:hypothetical protein
MPLSVHYNAYVIQVPPRIEEIVLFLLAHQEMICRTPLCALEFHCSTGREVKGKLKIELPKPTKIFIDKR